MRILGMVADVAPGAVLVLFGVALMIGGATHTLW